MSAIARWINAQGLKVAGYDRVETELTRQLTAEGIEIHYEDDVKLISSEFKGQSHTLVIITPAIPEDHSEMNFFRENNFTIKKRSEVLGMITDGRYTIAVAGTHGKTTTSSMIAHLLNDRSEGVTAFVGGIMSNYSSNLLIGDEDAPIVVEADEFDRSFLTLHPDVAVITSIDPDHLDIYKDEESLTSSFYSL